MPGTGPKGAPPPPPLPPRAPSDTVDTPPPYTEIDDRASEHPLHALSSRDPRSSSTQSLTPATRHGRRKLLLIYIHGFMGNETSFQSFPAHVHNVLTVTLRETHVVHTKIYPRYRSKNSIHLASEAFSTWYLLSVIFFELIKD